MVKPRGHNPSGAAALAIIVERLNAVPASGLITLAIVLLTGIGYLDVITGSDLTFGPFYQLPVILAAAIGPRRSTVIAALAAGVWTAVQIWQVPHPHPQFGVPAWNLITRFLVLWLVAALVSNVMRKLDQERHLSRNDFLTSLPNSRAFHETARGALTLMRRDQSALTVAFIDIDDFKAVNDLGGHAAGDDLLRTVGRTLAAAARPRDTVARIGGDEFAILLPATGKQQALDRLSAVHAELHQATAAFTPQVGFSIGAVAFTRAPGSGTDLLGLPDQLMYLVKQKGKDLVRAETAEAMSHLSKSDIVDSSSSHETVA